MESYTREIIQKIFECGLELFASGNRPKVSDNSDALAVIFCHLKLRKIAAPNCHCSKFGKTRTIWLDTFLERIRIQSTLDQVAVRDRENCDSRS